MKRLKIYQISIKRGINALLTCCLVQNRKFIVVRMPRYRFSISPCIRWNSKCIKNESIEKTTCWCIVSETIFLFYCPKSAWLDGRLSNYRDSHSGSIKHQNTNQIANICQTHQCIYIRWDPLSLKCAAQTQFVRVRTGWMGVHGIRVVKRWKTTKHKKKTAQMKVLMVWETC